METTTYLELPTKVSYDFNIEGCPNWWNWDNNDLFDRVEILRIWYYSAAVDIESLGVIEIRSIKNDCLNHAKAELASEMAFRAELNRFTA